MIHSSNSIRLRRAGAVVGSAVLAGSILAACGGSSPAAQGPGTSSHPTVASDTTLTISNGASGQFVANFSPFSPNAEPPTYGFIYEPLLYFDTVKANSVTPWLASSYAWSDGGRRITFQLRHGVTWTDGKPFTSADVAFTFNLEIHNKALNSYSLPFASVTTSGPYTVSIDFTEPAYQDLIYFGGKTLIIPEHIWKSVSNPQTFTNTHPVGTGPYELESVTGEAITLRANPHYYMSGLPKFPQVRFLSFSGNTSADAAIEAGQLDWASNFIPNVKQTYANNPEHHLVEVPIGTTFLVANDQQGPTASLAVRQAISDAINRSFVNQDVYDGEYGTTNPMALILPNYGPFLASSLANATLPYDPAKSEQILEAAGYKKGANGIFVAPDGKPLVISAQVISGYSDFISILQILQQELKQVGIQLDVQTESSSAFSSNQDNGTFQLAIASYGFTPSVYAYYYSLYDSKISAPIGKSASGDYGRYDSPEVDALLNKVATLQSASAQQPLFAQIEQILARDLPNIPILEAASGTEFNGAALSGFPSAANPYAGPDSWMEPDAGWVAMHLTPVK